MPGTKISCNSFYMFLMEIKRLEEMRGRRCSLQSLEPEASRRWETLPAGEKNAYKVFNNCKNVKTSNFVVEPSDKSQRVSKQSRISE